MSLPDTVFIFVLALIIFGPKKLPEIGRQIGKLVGEFRRASNEFKFQIEEELRQVDINDEKNKRQTIAAPKSDSVESEPLIASDDTAFSSDSADAAENIPVGQHPNIDSLDISGLSNPEPMDGVEAMPAVEDNAGSEISIAPSAPVSELTVTAAVGSQPRTMGLFDGPESSLGYPAIETNQSITTTASPASVNGTSAPIQEHAGDHPTSEHAEVNHG